jgi:hypothetical protein
MVIAELAQNRQPEEPSWAPKPVQPTKWIPPNKPHTKLSEVRAKHNGKDNWREEVVSDDHLHADSDEQIRFGHGDRNRDRDSTRDCDLLHGKSEHDQQTRCAGNVLLGD